ncbi:LysR family transcriptional regulator [Burkholderia diffusa]|uniref:LysR family transcriptional regulator n=1 Tax=Burkholderia diffusa TaxID=488732 RepID=A0A6P2PG68_9BURK|nr:LysR family transcriptional regulator [Burkholderia diffusa]KAB0656038.1 LysR family transcriptional regulator [Burkholderia diffusa]MBM2656021.1 LysR family transcriptional regulator [Burkholderia diffusa]VWC07773.1 LysR family transcriptional regulator [Burkholderia diffusa]
MMNLLEAMPVLIAVVAHGGASGAASDLKRGDAQVNARVDCLERDPGCRSLPDRAGDAMACTDAGVAFHPCCRSTLSEAAQAIAQIDACATVQDLPVGGFPPLETIDRVDGSSIAEPMPLHESSR